MNRETLMEQVKTTGHSDRDLVNMVLYEIHIGTFDSFGSGKDIMDAVSKDRNRWLSHSVPVI